VATIGKVSAVFSSNTSGLVSGTNAAGSAFKKLSGDVATLRSRMATLAATQGAQLFGQVASAARAAAGAFFDMAKGEADAIDQTSKLSRRLGMTYGELAGLSLAGDLAGVSMETIGKAATKADVAFVKAAEGSTQAKNALAGVGLSVDELQSRSPAERFQMMADAIAGLPSPAERARAAIGLFGKAGADLLPLFEGGAGSIRKAVEEANAFGLALTDEQGQSVENMNDAFTRAYASIQGVVRQVVAYLSPAVQSVTDSFTNLIGSIGGTTIGQFIGEGILSGAQFLAGVGDALISGLLVAWDYVGSVGSVWSSIFDEGLRFASFLAGVGRALQFGLQAAVLGVTATLQGVLVAVRDAAALVGLESQSLNASIAGMAGFNDSVVASMDETASLAARNMSAAFDESVGSGASGPLSSMLADALLKARSDANAINVSKRNVVGPQGGVQETQSREALKGVDSNSREGIAEMFRILRGGSDASIAEQQLEEQRRTNELLSESDPEQIMSMVGG
jgi:hypothetical protein